MLGITQLTGFGAGSVQNSLVTNGDFAGGSTGWTLGTGWAVTGGAAVHSGATTGSLQQASIFSVGVPYRITFDATISGTFNLWIAGTELVQSGITTGSYSKVWMPSTAGSLFFEAVNSAAVTLDNVAVNIATGRGSERITNGDFASGTGWSAGTGWSISGGVATHSGASSGNLTQTGIFVNGKVYEVSFTATVTGTFNLWIGGTELIQSGITSGNFSKLVRPGTVGSIFFEAIGSASITLDNVSVKEVT